MSSFENYIKAKRPDLNFDDFWKKIAKMMFIILLVKTLFISMLYSGLQCLKVRTIAPQQDYL